MLMGMVGLATGTSVMLMAMVRLAAGTSVRPKGMIRLTSRMGHVFMVVVSVGAGVGPVNPNVTCF
jgi:hypothetical protein